MKYTILVVVFVLFAKMSFAQVQGYVFWDTNSNGIKDSGESTLSGAIISNGFDIVKSGESGKFVIPHWDKARFVTIYPGTDYKCKQRFIKIEEGVKQYTFAIQTKNKKQQVSFVQISDTETFEHRDWVDNLKEYSKSHNPDFIIHTGDICYETGMKWHSENVTSETMGVPMYYCLGNHDLIKGDYGEQYFESCFGPAWYAFEEGNTLFVVTPMMGGDYTPGFTREEIGAWLKNLLKIYPKSQSKIFFNHDLLTDGSEFNFKVSPKKTVNLNDYNLKAWLYGHWHINMAKKHKPGNVISYGTATAVMGGIDHSPSGYRVVDVNEDGNTNSYFRWTYLNRVLEIVSPQKEHAFINENDEVEISVNTYDSGSKVDSVKYAIWGEEGFNWKSSLESEKWKNMTQNSDWNWSSSFVPSNQKYYELVVYTYLHNGEILHAKKKFSVTGNSSELIVDGSWFNLAGNKEHNAVLETTHKLPYQMLWTANAGGNIYMSSPVLYKNSVITATFDDGDANNCAIVCCNASTGKERWRYNVKNGVKNQMVVANNLVIATDMLGFTYAVNIDNGELNWEKDLNYNRLPGFITGLVSDGQTLYTGFGKSLSALNVTNGDVVWTSDSWGGGEGTTPTMTLADNVLITSKQWGAIYAHDTKNGKLLWSRSDDGLRFRDGVITYKDGYLWVAGRGTKDFGLGNLFKLNLKTGETIAKFPTNMQNTGTSAPIILDDMIIVAGSHPGIAAFERNSGDLLWQFEVGEALFYTPSYFSDRQQTIETTPVLIGDKIVFGAMDGCLYVLDVETGKQLWKTKLGSPILTSVAVSDNQIYICDFAGNIYCYKSKNK